MGITLVGVDYSTGAESCNGGKRLLAWDQRLLEIFGGAPCRFGIFWSGSMSVRDVDATDWITGEDMTFGYVGSRWTE